MGAPFANVAPPRPDPAMQESGCVPEKATREASHEAARTRTVMEQEQAPAGAAAPRPRPQASPRRRWLGTIVALAFVAALGALAWYLTHRHAAAGAQAGPGAMGPAGPGGRRGPPATTVNFAAATRADIPVYIDALGTVTPSATVTVTPQVSGVLTQVLYQEGQMVKRGQLLALVDPRPFELALMQAEGQQQRDAALLDAARVTLARYQTLLQQDSIARQDVDTQAATVKQLEGTVLTDKAAVGTARLNLAWTRIDAPVAGRVGLRTVDVGNLVSAGAATGVAVITELAPIDVEFAVPQDSIPALQARVLGGAKLAATVYDRTRTQVLDTGAFISLNNQADTQTGTVRAKARFANARGALFPSQFVNVRLQLDTVHDAIVVPVTALRHGPDGDFVYVLDRNRTVGLRKVTQGQSTADTVQITAGLVVGERVITEGGDRLKDGARVQLPGEGPASGAQGADGASAGGHGGRGAHHRGDRASAASDAVPGEAGAASRPGRRASAAASS
jgi:multidrug efflux system membrane fusion protein